MSRYHRRGRMLHGPECDNDELYFAHRGYDFDIPIRVRGRRIGHLLPGHIVNPLGMQRCRAGYERGVLCDGGLMPLGNCDCLGLGIGFSWQPPGLCRMSCRLANPYDPRQFCTERAYWPGAGLGLPCCPDIDAAIGGPFRLKRCPRGLCEELY